VPVLFDVVVCLSSIVVSTAYGQFVVVLLLQSVNDMWLAFKDFPLYICIG